MMGEAKLIGSGDLATTSMSYDHDECYIVPKLFTGQGHSGIVTPPPSLSCRPCYG